jgi:lactoylglutathione lyase
MHIEHLAIWTKDIERLKAFYETYFQARASSRYTNPVKEFASYFLSFSSGPRLEIMQMAAIPLSKNDAEVQFTGYIHMAFSVGSQTEVDALTQRLQQDGYQVVDGPRWTGDGYYESSVLDPDGNRIEITI